VGRPQFVPTTSRSQVQCYAYVNMYGEICNKHCVFVGTTSCGLSTWRQCNRPRWPHEEVTFRTHRRPTSSWI